MNEYLCITFGSPMHLAHSCVPTQGVSWGLAPSIQCITIRLRTPHVTTQTFTNNYANVILNEQVNGYMNLVAQRAKR